MPDALAITDRIVIPGADLSVETLRAGGPGGQHVNTTDSAVRLRFALDRCDVLGPAVKDRLRAAFPSRITQDGELLVHVQAHRSQHQNLEAARAQLADMIRQHLRAPPPRRPTRPTRASQKRRMDTKSARGAVKRLRGKVADD